MAIERDTALDALKGVAILAVIAGHAIALPQMSTTGGAGMVPFLDGFLSIGAAYSPLYNVIQSVNMPLFAFVSGLLLGLRPVRDGGALLKKRALTLLLPYAAWTALLALRDPGAALWRIARAALIPEAGAGWFLYVLFECYAVYVLARRFGERGLVVTALLVASTVLLPLPNVLGVRQLTLLLPFFIGGVLLASRSWWRSYRATAAAVAVYGVALALTVPTTVGGDRWWFEPVRSVIGGPVGTWGTSIIYHGLRYACGFAGIVLLYQAYARCPEWFRNPQAWLGRRSLGIYLSHVVLMQTAIGFGVTGALPLSVVSLLAAVGVTLLLERSGPVSRLLLGGQTNRLWPTPEPSANRA